MLVRPTTRYAVFFTLLFMAITAVSLSFRVRAQSSAPGVTQQMIRSNNYPVARKSDQVDDYHGTKVADPYRWLEDLDSEETRNWVEAENKLSFGFLGKIPPRDAIKKRITELWDYEKFGVPFKQRE